MVASIPLLGEAVTVITEPGGRWAACLTAFFRGMISKRAFSRTRLSPREWPDPHRSAVRHKRMPSLHLRVGIGLLLLGYVLAKRLVGGLVQGGAWYSARDFFHSELARSAASSEPSSDHCSKLLLSA